MNKQAKKRRLIFTALGIASVGIIAGSIGGINAAVVPQHSQSKLAQINRNQANQLLNGRFLINDNILNYWNSLAWNNNWNNASNPYWSKINTAHITSMNLNSAMQQYAANNTYRALGGSNNLQQQFAWLANGVANVSTVWNNSKVSSNYNQPTNANFIQELMQHHFLISNDSVGQNNNAFNSISAANPSMAFNNGHGSNSSTALFLQVNPYFVNGMYNISQFAKTFSTIAYEIMGGNGEGCYPQFGSTQAVGLIPSKVVLANWTYLAILVYSGAITTYNQFVTLINASMGLTPADNNDLANVLNSGNTGSAMTKAQYFCPMNLIDQVLSYSNNITFIVNNNPSATKTASITNFNNANFTFWNNIATQQLTSTASFSSIDLSALLNRLNSYFNFTKNQLSSSFFNNTSAPIPLDMFAADENSTGGQVLSDYNALNSLFISNTLSTPTTDPNAVSNVNNNCTGSTYFATTGSTFYNQNQSWALKIGSNDDITITTPSWFNNVLNYGLTPLSTLAFFEQHYSNVNYNFNFSYVAQSSALTPNQMHQTVYDSKSAFYNYNLMSMIINPAYNTAMYLYSFSPISNNAIWKSEINTLWQLNNKNTIDPVVVDHLTTITTAPKNQFWFINDNYYTANLNNITAPTTVASMYDNTLNTANNDYNMLQSMSINYANLSVQTPLSSAQQALPYNPTGLLNNELASFNINTTNTAVANPSALYTNNGALNPQYFSTTSFNNANTVASVLNTTSYNQTPNLSTGNNATLFTSINQDVNLKTYHHVYNNSQWLLNFWSFDPISNLALNNASSNDSIYWQTVITKSLNSNSTDALQYSTLNNLPSTVLTSNYQTYETLGLNSNGQVNLNLPIYLTNYQKNLSKMSTYLTSSINVNYNGTQNYTSLMLNVLTGGMQSTLQNLFNQTSYSFTNIYDNSTNKQALNGLSVNNLLSNMQGVLNNTLGLYSPSQNLIIRTIKDGSKLSTVPLISNPASLTLSNSGISGQYTVVNNDTVLTPYQAQLVNEFRNEINDPNFITNNNAGTLLVLLPFATLTSIQNGVVSTPQIYFGLSNMAFTTNTSATNNKINVNIKTLSSLSRFQNNRSSVLSTSLITNKTNLAEQNDNVALLYDMLSNLQAQNLLKTNYSNADLHYLITNHDVSVSNLNDSNPNVLNFDLTFNDVAFPTQSVQGTQTINVNLTGFNQLALNEQGNKPNTDYQNTNTLHNQQVQSLQTAINNNNRAKIIGYAVVGSVAAIFLIGGAWIVISKLVKKWKRVK